MKQVRYNTCLPSGLQHQWLNLTNRRPNFGRIIKLIHMLVTTRLCSTRRAGQNCPMRTDSNSHSRPKMMQICKIWAAKRQRSSFTHHSKGTWKVTTTLYPNTRSTISVPSSEPLQTTTSPFPTWSHRKLSSSRVTLSHTRNILCPWWQVPSQCLTLERVSIALSPSTMEGSNKRCKKRWVKGIFPWHTISHQRRFYHLFLVRATSLSRQNGCRKRW